MIRFHPIANAQAAIDYFKKSDSGYYLDGLHREWGGKASQRLGLGGDPDFEHFKNLIQGYNPHTGKQLTAKLVEDRIPGWDITASVPKGVTLALEFGDPRVKQAIWDANREAMADLEAYATTRVRKGGVHEDRVTGNMVWFSVEHAETRPAKEDNIPDPDRHIHNVVMNVTWDAKEREWKAVKFRPIMDQRKYFDRRFDSRLASKLTDLGYEIETKYKTDDKGVKKYYSWDIKGMPASLVKKNSRRSAEVDALAEELGVGSVKGKDKLGATSRLHKRKDLTLADLHKHWLSKATPEEAREVASLLLSAMSGKTPKPESKVSEAAGYAIEHHFYHKSVVDYHVLATTVMERMMGAGHPDQVMPELKRQGMLLKDGMATTKQVLAQEGRIIDFARDGKGTCRALAKGGVLDERLSSEQQAAIRHVWESKDRVTMVEGLAGVGKTTAQRAAANGIEQAGKRVIALAQSAGASRGALAGAGFKDATTIKAFLDSEKLQEQARGQVIFLDEGSLVGTKTMLEVFETANRVNARVAIWGDTKQHGAIERGSVMHALKEYAGLPVPKMTQIIRQKGKYKDAVESIAKGDVLGGYDILNGLGWIKSTPAFDHNKPLVDDYLEGLKRKKSMLVVAPGSSG